MRSESGVYIARLDHLRFFAAALVVAYHTFHLSLGLDVHLRNPLLLFVDEGHTAVALFLVISGFIFATLSRGSDIAYGPFIANRFLRIYPLLIFAVMLAASIQPQRTSALYLAFDYLTPLSTFGHNGTSLPMIAQLWSVLIEVQIYLLFPFLHRFQRESGNRYLLGLIALLVVLRGLAWLVSGSAQPIGYWTIFGRLDQFAIGMLLADWSRANRRRLTSPAWFIAALAVMYAVALWFDRLGGFYGDGPASHNAIWVVRGTIEAAAWGAVVVTYLHTSLTPGKFTSRVLGRLGEVSYSIYVMHLIVLQSASTYLVRLSFVANPPWDALLKAGLIVLPMTVALSFATYALIERPFLRMRRHYLRPLPASASQPALALVPAGQAPAAAEMASK